MTHYATAESASVAVPRRRIYSLAPAAESPLTVAEYFAGIGLVRMGLGQAGWKVLFANDWSESKREMYRAFFRDSEHYTLGDIFDIDPRDVPSTMLATCSFPCIDLSLAGNMNGISGKHSSAFWGFTKILKGQGDLVPPLVLVENVPGWLSSNGGADFRLTVKALNDLGYVCDVFTLNALHFVPQSRTRVFVVGAKNLGCRFDVEMLVRRHSSLFPERLKNAVFANQDLQWMSLEIPVPPPLLKDGLVARIIERLPASSGRWWPESEVSRHLAMMSSRHRDRIEVLAQKQYYSYKTFFRRRRQEGQRAEVRQDDIAGCLRTAVGGSSRQFLVVAGRRRIRMRNMTPREYARLQGVPDNYPIAVEENQALTGFGDAVCVPAIKWIAQNVLGMLIRQAIVSWRTTSTTRRVLE